MPVDPPGKSPSIGSIFGGVILSYIDQAGFVEALRHAAHRWVTVAMDSVEFKKPVLLGDVVSLYTTTAHTGTTSVTVRVDVEAMRRDTHEVIPVTSATITLVAIDETCKPIAFESKHPAAST